MILTNLAHKAGSISEESMGGIELVRGDAIVEPLQFGDIVLQLVEIEGF